MFGLVDLPLPLDGWMDGWVGERDVGWVDGWMDGWMDMTWN